jgi:hypothetical protein
MSDQNGLTHALNARLSKSELERIENCRELLQGLLGPNVRVTQRTVVLEALDRLEIHMANQENEQARLTAQRATEYRWGADAKIIEFAASPRDGHARFQGKAMWKAWDFRVAVTPDRMVGSCVVGTLGQGFEVRCWDVDPGLDDEAVKRQAERWAVELYGLDAMHSVKLQAGAALRFSDDDEARAWTMRVELPGGEVHEHNIVRVGGHWALVGMPSPTGTSEYTSTMEALQREREQQYGLRQQGSAGSAKQLEGDVEPVG